MTGTDQKSSRAVFIRTPRLTLREHRPDDLEPLHAILSEPAATWYLPDLYKTDIAETKAYLHSVMRDVEAPMRLRFNLIVAKRESGEVIGSVSLHVIDSAPDGAHYGLGYFIRPDRWNQGFGTEAARAALAFIFGANAWRVSASCVADNLASRRVLEKCGMTQEGLLRAHTWHDGQWKDCAVYAILRRAWPT